MPHVPSAPTPDAQRSPSARARLGRALLGIVLRIAVVMFVVELLIMAALGAAEADPWVGGLVDALLLTTVASLIIGLWVIRPYLRATQLAQASVEASEIRWRFALESAGAGMWEADLEAGTAWFSPRCRAILGHAGDEVWRSLDAWQQLTHPEDLPLVEEEVRAFLSGESEVLQVERRMLAADGSWKWLLDRAIAVARRDDGRPLRLIGTHADVTARRTAEENWRALAITDSLTGLPNRRQFITRLEEAHDLARRVRDQRGSVLMLDIDHFKAVNDSHGHPIGDAVLRHLAGVMSRVLRKTDTAGRIGGEEFAAVLIGADLVAAQAFAERLRARVQAAPLAGENLKIDITVSIGVTSLDPDDPDAEASLARCDRALYQAKQSGRNRVVVDAASAASVRHPGFVEMTWRDAYGSGDPAIDHQHRQLFETCNHLLHAMRDELPASDVATIVDRMVAELVGHFGDEEALLVATGYPQAAEHRRLHRKLAERARDLAARHHRGEAATADVFSFLAHEVTARHMLREDRKFFDHLRTRAPDLSPAD